MDTYILLLLLLSEGNILAENISMGILHIFPQLEKFNSHDNIINQNECVKKQQ